MKRMLVLVGALLLCVGIVMGTRYSKQPAGSATVNMMEAPATAATPLPRQPTRFGINLSTPAYWSDERAFMNLAAGGSWRSIRGGWHEMDPQRIDRNGMISSLQPGEQAALSLTRPPRSRAANLAIRCRFDGTGTVNGVAVVDPKATPGQLDFIWRSDVKTAHFRIDATDPADPIRNIDCREADADRKAVFDPAFVDGLRAYASVRFMDWMQANVNKAGDWQRRTLPTATIQASPQGVAVEHMVLLANLAKVDPWFVMPWRADAAYLENFARYVHDHLDPSLTAYVEMGNEIWNLDFAAAREALAEGQRAGLGTKDEARMRRYAQRATEAFVIWEKVYGKDRHRLVRVLSGQNAWPDLILYALDYKDTASHVDALASAPYFGQTLLEPAPADTADLTPLFPRLTGSIDSTFGTARRFKQIADSRGLRFVGYEGGQHVTYRGPDKTLMTRLQRDPRMGDSFRAYLGAWDKEFGDLLLIYHSTSPIGTTMHFGIAEYSGQPLAETPKRKALLDAIAATKR